MTDHCDHQLTRADNVSWVCAEPDGHAGPHHVPGWFRWPSGFRAQLRFPQYEGDFVGALFWLWDEVTGVTDESPG